MDIKPSPEVRDSSSRPPIQFGVGGDTKYYVRSRQGGSWGLWIQLADGSLPPFRYDAADGEWKPW